MKNTKYVLVNGYTSTGSSAVLNLLDEYKNVFVPDKEFRIIKDPFGIMDLEHALYDSTDLLNEDIAIRCFLWFAKKYSKSGKGFRTVGLNYKKEFGKDFYEKCIQYIGNLIDYEYRGYWWYLSLNKPYLRQIINKILFKLKIYDTRKHSKMSLVTKTRESFYTITKDFIDSIFSDIKGDANIIALDQAIPATHPGFAKLYFSNAKVINVERDPRDVYIDLITEEKRNGDIVGHVGFDVASTHNVQLYIDWFKKCRRKGLDGECLNIRFEDLILNYTDTKQKIFDYIGLDAEKNFVGVHILKPEVSRKNIGYWKNYEFQNEIREIEKALPEYLYKEVK